jgi:hypothetical protein
MALIAPAREQAALTAAELASRIEIPAQLPPRYDGEPIRHLSQSSVGLFYRCPEAFRRRYILGEKGPSTGVMFLGSAVDKTLAHYYERQLTTGEVPPLGELQELYRHNWEEQREREEEDRGIDWSDIQPEAARDIGLQGIGVALTELVPQLGRSVAVQRKMEFTLTPRCEWVVQGFIDLESEIERLGSDEPAAVLVDTKVKATPLYEDKADRDLQASLYLTGRWIEGNPAEEFLFAQLLRPGSRRSKVGSKITPTRRTVGQMRAMRARVALAASQIAAAYERYGPERPWGYTEPTHWVCSRRFCPHWSDCPGGAGL